MWHLKDLDIDNTANLVSLRADYHDSYEGGACTFVPHMDVLEDIQAEGEKGTFTKPYQGFETGKKTPYTFVHFPTFQRHCIHRQHLNRRTFNRFYADDGFKDFPTLLHQSHPYLSIANAYPKFIKHKGALTAEQKKIARSLQKIHDIWNKVDSSSPKRPSKRKRDENDGGAAHTNSKIRDEAARCEILTWVDNVTAARPLATITEDVILPDGETAREPYRGDWHDWCFPWKQPPKWSVFSSNDWAMQHWMCKLTDEPGTWADLSSEESSDGEVDWATGPDSTM